MTLYLAEAARGNLNGKTGDTSYSSGIGLFNTGSEVVVDELRSYPKYGWNYMYRHYDKDVRSKLAKYMIAAAKNNNIGYSQNSNWSKKFKNQKTSSRYGLWQQVRAGVAIKNAKPCNTDCATTVACCLEAALKACGHVAAMGPKNGEVITKTPVNTTSLVTLAWQMEVYRGDHGSGRSGLLSANGCSVTDLRNVKVNPKWIRKHCKNGDILVSAGHHVAVVVDI